MQYFNILIFSHGMICLRTAIIVSLNQKYSSTCTYILPMNIFLLKLYNVFDGSVK